MTVTALDAALEYAARGWFVFPIAPRGKLPMIPSAHRPGEPPCSGECGRDGHGFYDATTDAGRIAEWWRRWPTANLGLRTGVVFDVVDIDGPDGLAALNAHRADRPVTWGPEVMTGGGGWHLFHLPSGAGNRTAMLPKVDYRGAGGYVVAPPSVHPSGGTYRWAEMAGIRRGIRPWPRDRGGPRLSSSVVDDDDRDRTAHLVPDLGLPGLLQVTYSHGYVTLAADLFIDAILRRLGLEAGGGAPPTA